MNTEQNGVVRYQMNDIFGLSMPKNVTGFLSFSGSKYAVVT